MNKFTKIIAACLLVEAAFVIPAQAARAAHRPWLARQPRAASPVERERIRSAVPSEAKTSLTKGDQIAQQAARYRGTRYRFGGDSKSKGFDCSGLVHRIYNDLHLDRVPRTSGQLYKMGDPVHLSELRPGDLVFFKNTYKRGVSHVGVYAGDNRFIHAQNRRHGVTVTSLADPYYQLHYAGARRLY